MNVIEVRKKAKDLGVKVKKGMKKSDIILAVQKAENNYPCFGTAVNYCDQSACAWKVDCLPKLS